MTDKADNAPRPYTRLPYDLSVLINVPTAARIYGCSEKNIRAKLASGEIAGCKIGGSWRINRDEFLRQCGLV